MQHERARNSGLPPLLAFNIQAISIAEGVRAALSVAVIVALTQWLAAPGLMESALAALLTCLCDAGGPIRRRLPALLSFAVLGALITASFGLLRTEPVWLVVSVCAAAVFCTSYARVFGQSAMQVGNLLTVVLVLAVRAPIPSLSAALAPAGMFLAGSLWALLLTMVIWRLHPYRPARVAVAECYRLMAALCVDLSVVLRHDAPEETQWDRHARQHRRQVREAIEQARAAVLSIVRVRGPVTGRAAQSWIRLEAADQLFAALIALSDMLAEPFADVAAREQRQRAKRMLRMLEPVLLTLARAIAADTHRDRPAMERAAEAIGAVAVGQDGADAPLARIAATIQEKLGIAIRLSGQEATLPDNMAGAGPRGWWPIVQGHFRRDSEVLRHAARAAVLAAPAFAVTLIWPGPYEHWLTITLVLTMQPYFALTVARAAERIGGTVLGGALAALLALVCTTPLAMAAAMFPLAVAALSVRAVSFGLFMACLTPLVVLLSELGRPGESEFTIALMRALFTLAGGLLALLGNLLLWPVWEPERIERDLRGAVLAHGRYAAAEIAGLLGEREAAEVEAARRAAGLASNALEATLQRAMLDRRLRADGRLEAALVVDAAMRRMAGRLSNLHLTAAREGHDLALWRAWARWLDDAAATVADGPGSLAPRPTLPEHDAAGEALARVAAQLELAAGAMQRRRSLQSSPSARPLRMAAAG